MIRRIPHYLIPISLFLLVLGLKFTVIDQYGSDLPVWDQWDAEGLHIFVPWAEHHLSIGDFFRPHNEHRIVLTKLLGLGELLLNGQWDARLQCVVNAMLHSTLAVLMFLLCRYGLERRLQPILYALIALLFGLPLAWQNVLGGFHSQQYFLLVLSFWAIRLLPASRPWTRHWWAGVACAVLALFSMGSGFFAAFVVAALILMDCVLGRQTWRQTWPTLVLCAVLCAVGWLTRVTVWYHDGLRAHAIADFVLYTLHSLQWPSSQHPWLALIGWAPMGVLLVACLTERNRTEGAEFTTVTLGLGFWTFLQVVASAYARGAGGGMPASRYMDTLAFGMCANAMALGWLWQRSALRHRSWAAIGSVLWLLALGLGLQAQCRTIYGSELPDVHAYLLRCESNVRNYLATEDSSYLREPNVPYPGVASFRERVDIPALRAILPASVRPPIELVAIPSANGFQVHDTRRAPPGPDALPATGQSTATNPTGLAPGTPPLENRRYWSSYGANLGSLLWNSELIHSSWTNCLRFYIAGNLGHTGVELAPTDPLTGAVSQSLRKSRDIAPPGWQAYVMAAPHGPLALRASVEGEAQWLAFSDPVELPLLSYWAGIAVTQGRLIWTIALALGLACFGTDRLAGWSR